jgi:aspartate aminotransferase
MNGEKFESYAEDVAQRGVRVYEMLHMYDGADCVNLYHGDGALPPHPVVRNALREVADTMEVWGETEEKRGGRGVELKRYRVPTLMTVPRLRNAILDDFIKYMPPSFNRDNAIVHTAGGVTHLAAALFNYFRKTNATVMMFAPTYTSFLFSASTVNCHVHLVQPINDGLITLELIEKSINEYPNIKYIFFPNPNNPTGQYFTKDELDKIARLAIKHDLIIISDEIFRKLVYDHENPFISIASVEIDGKLMFERTITLRSVSKDHGLAAVRSGYAIGHKQLMDKLVINWFTFGTTFNVDDLAQHVTIAALTLTPDKYYIDQQNLLRHHRDIVIDFTELINQTVGYKALKSHRPSAGIFQIIDASGLRGQLYRGKILDSDITHVFDYDEIAA